MGYAKLNIWLRDEQCSPYYIRSGGSDWIEIDNCMDRKVIPRLPIPVGEAHVEAKVPPGCYKVHGHVCEPQPVGNIDTDKAMVTVGINQELCVDLFLPGIRTCMLRDVVPLIRAAQAANMPPNNIAIAVQTMMRIGNISQQEMAQRIEEDISALKDVKGADGLAKEYRFAMDIIKGQPKLTE